MVNIFLCDVVVQRNDKGRLPPANKAVAVPRKYNVTPETENWIDYLLLSNTLLIISAIARNDVQTIPIARGTGRYWADIIGICLNHANQCCRAFTGYIPSFARIASAGPSLTRTPASRAGSVWGGRTSVAFVECRGSAPAKIGGTAPIEAITGARIATDAVPTVA